MNWIEHPEHLDTLRTMAAAGISAKEIGKVLCCGKNAVVGAAHRNGIPLKQTIYGSPRPRNRPRGRQKMSAVPQPPIEQPSPARPAEPAWPCSLMELTNESCRWIISANGPPYLFCNALEADLGRGVAYCGTHAAIAYQRRPGT
jgi:GcrA cell cycle regulator